MWLQKQGVITDMQPNPVASTPGPRSYKIYTGGNNTRFLGMWLADSSHGNRGMGGRGELVSLSGHTNMQQLYLIYSSYW